jgi:protein SCO1
MSAVGMRTALATALVALAGASVLTWLTHGFTSLTAESARRAAVASAPVAVPRLQGVDQSGEVRDLFSEPAAEGRPPRVAIVDFIYTRCNGVCSALGSTYQQLQTKIRERGLEDEVRLITVSFDPERDSPAALAQYAARLQADPRLWTVATPLQPAQLPELLSTFGIVVLPAELPGEFQHNAAFHVLNTEGRLARIVDIDDPMAALEEAISISRRSARP